MSLDLGTDANPHIEMLPLESAHLDAITAIHLSAYHGQVNFSQMLGPEFVRRTYEWFCASSDRFGYVCLVNEAPAGFIVGSECFPHRSLNRYRLPVAIKLAARHPRLVLSRRILRSLAHRVSEMRRPDRHWGVEFSPDDFLFLYSLASLSEYAPYRIANRLLRQCETHAFMRKKHYLLCSVGKQNLSSLMVHRMTGFVVDKKMSDDTDVYFYKAVANSVVHVS